jgi:hypothetical protein
LGIERSLTGDDEIGLLDAGRKIEGIGDEIEARMELSLEKIHQAETESACCSCPRHFGKFRGFGDFDEMS